MQYGERTRRSPIRAVRATHAPGVTNEFPAGLDDLQRKITCLELEHTASATILDRFQVGVFVADTDGFVLQVKRTARAIAAGCDEIPTVTDASMRFESIWFHRLVDPLINRDDTARDHRIVSFIPRSSRQKALQGFDEP